MEKTQILEGYIASIDGSRPKIGGEATSPVHHIHLNLSEHNAPQTSVP